MNRCNDCGEYHDVEDEARVTGTGHDLIQVQRINECDKKRYPDEESLA